jgi:hypothetical protein
MQAQAAKRASNRFRLKAALVLVILLGVALSAMAIVMVVDRSDSTALDVDSVTTAPQVAVQQEDIQQEPFPYELPDEAVDAQLGLDRPESYYSQGQGEGLIDGQLPHGLRIERSVPADFRRFLEQNLYLPGDADTTLDIQLIQQLYWELEAPRAPASSTASYDDRNGTSGQWTEGIAER